MVIRAIRVSLCVLCVLCVPLRQSTSPHPSPQRGEGEAFARFLKSEETLDFIGLERVKGIEPSSQAWEARILPLNHTRRRIGKSARGDDPRRDQFVAGPWIGCNSFVRKLCNRFRFVLDGGTGCGCMART